MHRQSADLTTGLTPAGLLDARLRGDEKKALAFCDWVLGTPERGSAVAMAWLAQWHTLGALNTAASPPTRGMLWRPLLTRLPAQTPALEEAKPEFEDLASLPTAARIAVLLALLGLTPEDSAEAMRLSMHAHAERLAAGLPRAPDGSVDGARWQAWARALHAYVEHLPLDRTAPLIQARLHGQSVALETFDDVSPEQRRRVTRRNLMLVGVGCATLMALTFVPSVRERIAEVGEVRVETRTLEGLADMPAKTARPSPTETLPLDPVTADLAFYAWYARQRLDERPSTVLEPLIADPTPNLPESDDAP